MKLSLQSRGVLLGTLLVVAIGAGVAVLFLWQGWGALPRRGSPEYREYQRAFQIGLAALETGQREELAAKSLDRAIELIPGEPAGWANRGLLHLRKNNLKQAAMDLHKAHQLAPESAEIEALLGILAEKQGRLPEAVSHLRKAVAKQPRVVASLYALAEAVSAAGEPGHEAEYQRLMEQIITIEPNNLPALVKLADAAQRNKDQPALGQVLERLGRLEPNWNPKTKKQFDDVSKAAAAAPKDLTELLPGLNRLLQGERGYVRDALALSPRLGVIGAVVPHFLRLEPARSSPAPPDRELTFKLETLSVSGPAGPWDIARPVWLVGKDEHEALVQSAVEGGQHVHPANAFKPAIFVANAREVRRAGPLQDRGAGEGAPPVFPFPSGPKALPPSSAGLLPLDWDNDFRTDLLLAGAGGLRFWQQKADGIFADVTGKTALEAVVLGDDYYGAWAADIEMDGDLDIILARRSGPPLLLRNNRDGTFKGIELFQTVSGARDFAWADLDGDGAPDAIFLDAAGKLHVFANDRSGQFSPWALPEKLGRFLALTTADVNGDGVLDIVALRADGVLVRISSKNKRESWDIDEISRPLAAVAGERAGMIMLFAQDLDNNGALDIVTSDQAARTAHIFLANEEGKLVLLPESVALQVAAVIDLDRDGRLDLLGLSRADTPVCQPMRALNQSGKGYRFQDIWPLANPKAGDDRVNSFAQGGEIEMRAGGLLQKQAINGPVVHFGLGEEDAVDVVRIVWPYGASQWEFDVPQDKLVLAAQRLSGSCPFLFTHNGTDMQFAGDFMWGTPLGMYVNGQNIGDFPQTTEWLKIPGNLLRPRDGYYDVRVHANLWETDYFDQLALIVVDHPPGTEIHVDERFFLTPTAPRLYVTTPAQPVARAWDHEGKDVTDLIQAIDGRYLDHCGRGRFQGVTGDHWVEVDLGDDAPKEGPIYLVARGWLHPTNSSINLALAQGKHDMPRPLSLEVPDGNGGWKIALPALGFPAGKNKTMMIRLDGCAGKGVCRRFRLRTNMEIYWDYLGFARDLDPGLARLHRPTPSVADLRFRGMLAMTQKDGSSPELPVYDKVIRGGQQWRDLEGYYTRFGDVRELLAKVDDRYVIMNAGDEISLRFPVPESAPTGWRRDFIWESDGWTRDGDLNTRFGNTVLPLPAHGLKNDQRPGSLEDDPVYRRFPRDWQTYHTRYVTAEEFALGLWAIRRPMEKK